MTEIHYRPAGIEDAELAADLMTAAFPREPEDPVLTRYRWEHPRGGWEVERFIATDGAEPVAFLSSAHASWDENPERHAWLEVYLDLQHMDAELLRDIWVWLEQKARGQGVLALNAAAAEEEKEMDRVLHELGYARDRTNKMWSLDLVKHGSRLTAEAETARDRARENGMTYTTVAAWSDPHKLAKIHALDQLTRLDIPRSVPMVPESLESFLARSNPPDRPHQRWWLALDRDAVVAMSYLSYPPVRGHVWTHYTCSHKDYRGRGLARGVKLQTLAQAFELGVPFVRADNDSENAPMLHINETLGYEAVPGFGTYQKRVNK